MENKINIELSPFDALTILSFLHEFDFTVNEKLQSLNNASQNFLNEVQEKISVSQIDDAYAERSVKRLFNKEP